jgi:hypothetical protein
MNLGKTGDSRAARTAGLVRAVAAPHPKGLLRDPDAAERIGQALWAQPSTQRQPELKAAR